MVHGRAGEARVQGGTDMTTKVTVDAHAGWPVSIQRVHPDTLEPQQPASIVEPGQVEIVHVWSDSALIIREQPKPTKPQE